MNEHVKTVFVVLVRSDTPDRVVCNPTTIRKAYFRGFDLDTDLWVNKNLLSLKNRNYF